MSLEMLKIRRVGLDTYHENVAYRCEKKSGVPIVSGTPAPAFIWTSC